MKKHNTRHGKKIRNLVVISTLCAVVLIVSTYAWFIGMQTVNVSSFDVEIATTEGLFLSMDGEDWKYKLDAKNTPAYVGNTNNWLDGENEGLIPISTVGDMDSTTSRLKLYEKASLTTTKGGYRLLTSRVDNYTKPEGATNYNKGDGYVVFDLFIKNLSGNEYYRDNQPLNEENIYLTVNSNVKVASSGKGGVENTGIENSVRVAFAQIGRVKIDENIDPTIITGITCANSTTTEEGTGKVTVTKDPITGICRDATIWEPNDEKHEVNAINWYDKSCKTRITPTDTDKLNDVTSSDTYNLTGSNVACNHLEPTVAYPTYAISRVIGISDQVDVYDGKKYNTYEQNTATYSNYKTAYNNAVSAENADEDSIATAMSAYKLVDFPYFTDKMKNVHSVDRPKFMTLAPNSITKVRVYIYIEGQDIDNYDFASLGKKITVNFGFTKERYIEDDFKNYEDETKNYNGPDTGTGDNKETLNPVVEENSGEGTGSGEGEAA